MNLIQSTILAEIMLTREVRRIEEDDNDNVIAHLDKFDHVYVRPSGQQMWFAGKDIHRENGPAVVLPNGEGTYFRYGRLHREDGPANLGIHGGKQYYIDGKPLTARQFKAWQKAQQ